MFCRHISRLLYNVTTEISPYYFCFVNILSGAADQRDLLLSQPAPPSEVELQPVGAGPQVQGGCPQYAKVFVLANGRISHFLPDSVSCL